MHFILFDETATWKNLLPLTFTRPVSEIRIGILTIKQKWDKSLKTNCAYHCEGYLQEKFQAVNTENGCFINASLCPDKALIEAIAQLKDNTALVQKNKLLAFKGNASVINNPSSIQATEYNQPILQVNQVWEIFQKNQLAIEQDFELITRGRTSEPLSKTVTVIGNPYHIFLEKGAKAEACIINTSGGPVYLAEDSEIMEGSVVRGPFALGEHSALKLSTKIYGPTTIGPHSKVGGEVNNSVVFGYSNKAHDGFLGNSVIGEWCNLGADTNNSNLKNNYSNVKLYNYNQKKQTDTGLQFCGLIMGDYSKSGINTMFNTGTVVGVGCNIYGGGFPATHIPEFSWGGSEGFEEYKLDKLFETSERVFARRGLVFDDKEKTLLKAIRNLTLNSPR